MPVHSIWRRRASGRSFGAAVLAAVAVAALLAGAGPAATADDLPGFDARSGPPPGQQPIVYKVPTPLAVMALPAPPGPDAPEADQEAFQDYLSSLDLSEKVYTPGSIAHFFVSWLAYLESNPDTDFEEYRRWYVTMITNGIGGRAFERLMNDLLGYDEAQGWRLDRRITGASGLEKRRRPDAYHPAHPDVNEYKAKDKLEGKRELSQLRDNVKIADQRGGRSIYWFNGQPTAETLALIDQANANASANRNRPPNTPAKEFVVARGVLTKPEPEPIGEDAHAPPLPAFMRPVTGRAPPGTAPDAPTTTAPGGAAGRPGTGGDPVAGGGGGQAMAGVLADAGQYAADGGLSAAVAASPDSAKDAAAQARLAAQFADEFDDEDLPDPEPTGGVDFSTLELRYVADAYRGAGARFAFRADAAPTDEPAYGGRRAAQLASDSFFVWLALPVSAFTVNLHPDEPHRIIDEAFGRTDAGRVLLEADLLLKQTTAKLIHPDTPGGGAFWESLAGDDRCLTLRQWIVPAPARVRETETELLILDAPLAVKMETEYFQRRGAGGAAAACAGDPRAAERNEAVYRSLILPRVERAVNEAPEYADLRRVYYSRVAAQWYRDRAASRPNPYAHLIDTGDVDRWTSRRPWRPRTVFDRYVESFTEGEFNVERRTRRGNAVVISTYVFGGVDFTSVTREDQNQGRSTGRLILPQAVERSLAGAAGERDGREVWLGGLTTTRPVQDLVAGPAAPTSGPLFYVLVGAPVLAWVAAGAWLLRRWRRRRPGSQPMPTGAGP